MYTNTFNICNFNCDGGICEIWASSTSVVSGGVATRYIIIYTEKVVNDAMNFLYTILILYIVSSRSAIPWDPMALRSVSYISLNPMPKNTFYVYKDTEVRVYSSTELVEFFQQIVTNLWKDTAFFSCISALIDIIYTVVKHDSINIKMRVYA